MYRILATIWFVVIVLLSLSPKDEVPVVSFLDGLQIDKVIHVGMYLVFTFLCLKAMSELDQLKHKSVSIGMTYTMCLIIVTFSMCIESLQFSMNVGRHFDVWDIFANIMGVILGYILWRCNIL